MSLHKTQYDNENKDKERKLAPPCSFGEQHGCHRAILSHLNQCLPPLWIALPEDNGVNLLLLSRDQERSVQRRAFFSFSGQEEIFVHRKQICGTVLDSLVLPKELKSVDLTTKQGVEIFVQRIATVLKRLKGSEVCMGVHEIEYKPLWSMDKSGHIDNNPFGELRYQETFRPFACQLLVPTLSYMKRRCSVCIQTKIKFRVKLKRHLRETANPRTPNVYLDRYQLINKVNSQRKQLKNSRAQLVKLKTDLQHSLFVRGLNGDDSLSDEILKICMDYTMLSKNLEIGGNV